MAGNDDKFERYKKHLPKSYKVGQNPVITALMEAISEEDCDVNDSIKNTKAQIFVTDAEGKFLDRLGNNRGVARPTELGLLDSDYRKMIPVMSFQPKQIRKIFYDLMDVFWGPLFSRANVSSGNIGPYDISVGEDIKVKIDKGEEQVIRILAGQIAVDGAATAEEVVTILSRIKGVTPSIIEDVATGTSKVNVRTNTPGARGAVEFTGGSAIDALKLDFDLKTFLITDLDQRTVVYELTHRELIIELPAVLPVLRRTLRGSHHFHADATLTGDNHIGSFLFSPNGNKPYTVTSQRAQLQSAIEEGEIYTNLTVNDTSSIEEESGFLIFDFGKDTEEQPVKYLSVPNSNTILIDPSHIFEHDHGIGSTVNVITDDLQPLAPATSGDDFAVYLTSPSDARQLVQELLASLAAAGVIVTFIIKFPEYKYLCGNPYNVES